MALWAPGDAGWIKDCSTCPHLTNFSRTGVVMGREALEIDNHSLIYFLLADSNTKMQATAALFATEKD